MDTDKFFIYDGKKYSYHEMNAVLSKVSEDARLNSWFRTALGMVEGKKILDVGCSAGILTRILAEQGKEIVGIDILDSVIDIAKTFNQAPGIEYRCGDIFRMNFENNRFDCILFLETIEHLEEPTRFLKEFLRILKPGGCLVISTPNAASYINILFYALFVSKKKQQKYIDSLKFEPRNTGTQLDHIFCWDFRTFTRYLIRNGFEYSSHKFIGAPPFSIRIGGLPLSIIGKKEMKFILPFLGPYLTTLMLKVKKPLIKEGKKNAF